MTTATRDTSTTSPTSTPARTRTRQPKDDRPAPAAQPGDIRRIFKLFGEHKSRLALVGLLIVASSLISPGDSLYD